MVVTRSRGAAQAIAVAFRFRYIAETAAILRDGAAVLVAVASHCGQILERAIRLEHIHKGLKLPLKFPGVELVAVVRPPAVVEFFSGRSEVHPHMAYRAQRRILGLVQLGIEKARLLNGSGPQYRKHFRNDSFFRCSITLHFTHLVFACYITSYADLATGTLPQRQSKVYRNLMNKGDILHLDMKICDVLI